MDLLDESQLLRNLSFRYGLPLLSNARDEAQNHENPLLSKQMYERTGICYAFWFKVCGTVVGSV